MSARLVEVTAVGGPCDGVVLGHAIRWNDRNVWNVEVERNGNGSKTVHRYVKKARSEVAEYNGQTQVIARIAMPGASA